MLFLRITKYENLSINLEKFTDCGQLLWAPYIVCYISQKVLDNFVFSSDYALLQIVMMYIMSVYDGPELLKLAYSHNQWPSP